MDFRDKDGAPLIKWTDAEGAFKGWRECTKGRPCDYSGMSYARLEKGPLQWPCNEQFPDGRERLYTDGTFSTAPDYCETFGHDLQTGAVTPPAVYKAIDPKGRAFLKPAEYQEPHEKPDDDYPFMLTTGRVVYHFHTRTKTARSRALNEAAPDAFVQLAAEDADRLGIAEGDMVDVESRRGRVRVAARVGDIIPGHAFIPFHYGDWDHPDHARAANELTITEWDPVSKQPHFKYAAVRLSGVSLASKAADLASGAAHGIGSALAHLKGAIKAEESVAEGRRHVGNYLDLARRSEQHLAESFRAVAEHHGHEPDILQMTRLMASWSEENARALLPLVDRFEAGRDQEPENLHKVLFHGPRSGGLGLVRDLHDLWLLGQEVDLAYDLSQQAARALRDEEMEEILSRAIGMTRRQTAWIRNRIDHAAPQALAVPT